MAEIRIGLVGTGFIAQHLTREVARRSGVRIESVLSRRPSGSIEGFASDLITPSIDDTVKRADVVVECSGDPVWATEVVAAAVAADRPVVTMNTEFHITTGSSFIGDGIVTEAEGDQPGCLASLHEDAVAMGFEPIAYGNMKGFLNLDPTREDMEFWGAKQGISRAMVTSFTDGTKVQAEQVLVANHFGATIVKEGMLGASVGSLEQGAALLAESADRLGRPISDFIVSAGLPHGVFIVATHDESQRDALAYYKLGNGPFYTLIRNNIFVHLEIIKTIHRVLDRGEVLLDNGARPELSLAAIAKRTLASGEMIDTGIGSFAVRGHAVRIGERPDHVPIGLVSQARVEQPIEPGELLTFANVDLPDSEALVRWNALAANLTTPA